MINNRLNSVKEIKIGGLYKNASNAYYCYFDANNPERSYRTVKDEEIFLVLEVRPPHKRKTSYFGSFESFLVFSFDDNTKYVMYMNDFAINKYPIEGFSNQKP